MNFSNIKKKLANIGSLIKKCTKNTSKLSEEKLVLVKTDDVFDEILGLNDPTENIRTILKITESNSKRLGNLERELLSLSDNIQVIKDGIGLNSKKEIEVDWLDEREFCLSDESHKNVDKVEIKYDKHSVGFDETTGGHEVTSFDDNQEISMLYNRFLNNFVNNTKVEANYLLKLLEKVRTDNFSQEDNQLEIISTKVAIELLWRKDSWGGGYYSKIDDLFGEYLIKEEQVREELRLILKEHPEQIISELILEVLPRIDTVMSVNYRSTELRTFHQGICKYLNYEIPFELLLSLLSFMGFKYKKAKSGKYFANFSKNGDYFLAEYY